MKKLAILAVSTVVLAACSGENSPFGSLGSPTGSLFPNDQADQAAVDAAKESVEATEAAADDVVDEAIDAATDAAETASETADEAVEDMQDSVEEKAEEVVSASAGGQCLATKVLANDTFAVIDAGTKGTIEEASGKTYFVASGTRHDITNIPYALKAC